MAGKFAGVAIEWARLLAEGDTMLEIVETFYRRVTGQDDDLKVPPQFYTYIHEYVPRDVHLLYRALRDAIQAWNGDDFFNLSGNTIPTDLPQRMITFITNYPLQHDSAPLLDSIMGFLQQAVRRELSFDNTQRFMDSLRRQFMPMTWFNVAFRDTTYGGIRTIWDNWINEHQPAPGEFTDMHPPRPLRPPDRGIPPQIGGPPERPGIIDLPGHGGGSKPPARPGIVDLPGHRGGSGSATAPSTRQPVPDDDPNPDPIYDSKHDGIPDGDLNERAPGQIRMGPSDDVFWITTVTEEVIEVQVMPHDSDAELEQFRPEGSEYSILRGALRNDPAVVEAGWSDAPDDVIDGKVNTVLDDYQRYIVEGRRMYSRPNEDAPFAERVIGSLAARWMTVIRRCWIRAHQFSFRAAPNWARSVLDRLRDLRVNIAASIWRALGFRAYGLGAAYAAAHGLLRDIVLDRNSNPRKLPTPGIQPVPDIPTDPQLPSPPVPAPSHADLIRLFVDNFAVKAIYRTHESLGENEGEEVVRDISWLQVLPNPTTAAGTYSQRLEQLVALFNTVVNVMPYRTSFQVTIPANQLTALTQSFLALNNATPAPDLPLVMRGQHAAELVNNQAKTRFEVANSLGFINWEVGQRREYLTLRPSFTTPSIGGNYLAAPLAREAQYEQYATQLVNKLTAENVSAFDLWEMLCEDWCQAPDLSQGAVLGDPSMTLENAIQTHTMAMWTFLREQVTPDDQYAYRYWQTDTDRGQWPFSRPIRVVGSTEVPNAAPLAYMAFMANLLNLVLALTNQTQPNVAEFRPTSVVNTLNFLDRQWWSLVQTLEKLKQVPAPTQTLHAGRLIGQKIQNYIPPPPVGPPGDQPGLPVPPPPPPPPIGPPGDQPPRLPAPTPAQPDPQVKAWSAVLQEIHTTAKQAIADERATTTYGRKTILDVGSPMAEGGSAWSRIKSIELWKVFWAAQTATGDGGKIPGGEGTSGTSDSGTSGTTDTGTSGTTDTGTSGTTDTGTSGTANSGTSSSTDSGTSGGTSQFDDQTRAYDDMSRPRLIYGDYWGDSKTHNPIKNTQGKFATEAEAKQQDPQAHKHVRGKYGVSGFDGENPAYQIPEYLSLIPLEPLFAEDDNANQLRQYLALTPLTDIPPWVRGVPGVNQFLQALQQGNAFGISNTPNDYGLSPQQMIQQAQGRGDNLKVSDTEVKALMDQVNMTYTPKQWQHNNLWTVDHRGPITELQMQRAREDLADRRLALKREHALLDQEIAMTGLHTLTELTPQQEQVVDTQLGKRYDKPWRGAHYQNKLNGFSDAYPNRHLGESYPQINNWPSGQPGQYSALQVVDSEQQRRQHQTAAQAHDAHLKAQLYQMMMGHSMYD